jgi:ABC-type Fe3+ transport system permease subunit
MLPILAIFYLAQQVAFFNSPHGERLVDHFKIGAWALLSAVLLAGLVTGGFWLRKPELRAMLNDELSRAHRADALRIGFILAMVAGIVLYVVGTAVALSDREVIHLIVSVGIGTALIRFGMLERRGDSLG